MVAGHVELGGGESAFEMEGECSDGNGTKNEVVWWCGGVDALEEES